MPQLFKSQFTVKRQKMHLRFQAWNEKHWKKTSCNSRKKSEVCLASGLLLGSRVDVGTVVLSPWQLGMILDMTTCLQAPTCERIQEKKTFFVLFCGTNPQQIPERTHFNIVSSAPKWCQSTAFVYMRRLNSSQSSSFSQRYHNMAASYYFCQREAPLLISA